MKGKIYQSEKAPDFDDIVFEVRNKEYGAYVLRRNYRRTVAISLLISVLLMLATVLIPYLSARAMDRTKREERTVETVVMTDLDTPAEQVAPPPPPPPPAETVEQAKYVPPVVVDTLKPEESMQFMTADEAVEVVQNTEVVDIPQEVKEEVAEEEGQAEPFIIVEEMPSFPGGERALLEFIGKNVVYPPLAQENNIQGVVIVRFCVTPKGGVSMVGILKGVDPELDKEAMRVVTTLPTFNPGKQGGKPVSVWFQVPIRFQLKNN